MAEQAVPAGETVGSIGRAVAAIRCVARGGAEGRRLSDVAREIGLHKATAARVLATLTETGVLRREDDRRYRIAPQFLEALGLPVSLGALRQRARGELMELVEKVEDTGLLSVRSGLESLCIDRHVGRHPLQALSLDVGARRPLGAGAGSLALLAFLPRDERETILAALADQIAALASHRTHIAPGVNGHERRNRHGPSLSGLMFASSGARICAKRKKAAPPGRPHASIAYTGARKGVQPRRPRPAARRWT